MKSRVSGSCAKEHFDGFCSCITFARRNISDNIPLDNFTQLSWPASFVFWSLNSASLSNIMNRCIEYLHYLRCFSIRKSVLEIKNNGEGNLKNECIRDSSPIYRATSELSRIF